MNIRPNKNALTEALDIYRDAMRTFIVRSLKRVPGGKVKDHIAFALRGDKGDQFQHNLDRGVKVEEAIDINDFPWLVKSFWDTYFRKAFKSDNNLLDKLHTIAEVRNKVSHPGNEDIELSYALERLNDITGVLATINESRQGQVVERIKEEIMPFKTTAHKFQQGGRDVYAFSLDLETLDELLPDRLDDRVVKDANRPLTQSHANGIQKYLEDRRDWLLGPLLLGISREAVEYKSYVSDPQPDVSAGELSIRKNKAGETGYMKMFDGQHRRRAIKDVLKLYSRDAVSSKNLTSLKVASLPIMLYVEDDIQALRQMFADAAQTRSIERNTLTRFDQRDAFNQAALYIAENSDLFIGRVEMERASVPRGSHSLVAINQLAMTLKTLEVGYNGRIRKDQNDEHLLDIEALFERCWVWADDFLPASRREYNSLMAGEIDNSDIPGERAKTMAYNATVIRILAGCYNEWMELYGDWKQLAQFIEGQCLSPESGEDNLLVQAGIVAPGGTSPVARHSLVAQAIRYIVGEAMKSGRPK